MWISNSPEATARLREADKALDRAMAAAEGLPLAAKVSAIRAARAARQDAYHAEFRMWEG